MLACTHGGTYGINALGNTIWTDAHVDALLYQWTVTDYQYLLHPKCRWSTHWPLPGRIEHLSGAKSFPEADPFHICTSYQTEGVWRAMFVSKLKNLKFW